VSAAVTTGRPLLRPGSLGTILLAHTGAQFLSFVRNVALSAVSVVMPVMLFALIAMSGADRAYAPGVTFGAFYLASMAAYAVSGIMVFNFGVTVAVDRGEKIDLLMRAVPLPPILYLLARVLTALAFALIALVVLFGFAQLVVGVRLPLDVWLRLGAVLLVGSVQFSTGIRDRVPHRPQRCGRGEQPDLSGARLRVGDLHADGLAARIRAADRAVPAHVPLRAARLDDRRYGRRGDRHERGLARWLHDRAVRPRPVRLPARGGPSLRLIAHDLGGTKTVW